MRKLLVLLLLLATLLPASRAHASVGKEIRVDGLTSWPETIEVIRELRGKWGLPISEQDCRPGERYCIRISHYRAKDGNGGVTSGWTGNADIRVNDQYDQGHYYRKAILYHELLHATGIWTHSAKCDSSTYYAVPACGMYIMGPNPAEHRWLLKEWT